MDERGGEDHHGAGHPEHGERYGGADHGDPADQPEHDDDVLAPAVGPAAALLAVAMPIGSSSWPNPKSLRPVFTIS